MKIVEAIMTNNPCYKTGKKITVKGLMLHSVGTSQPSAMVFVERWNKSTYTRACVHGFIDANTGVIYQTLPWNHRGWHAGGKANGTHIGVEMCEPGTIKYTGSGAKFTILDKKDAIECAERTYKSAVELYAMLCKKYKLDPMKDICSHKEGHALGIASNHGDPEHLWKGLGLPYTMDTFRRDVKIQMAAGAGTTTPKKEDTFMIEFKKMQKGSKGEDVRALQYALLGRGYKLPKYGADADYGAETVKAVKAFQKAEGLTQDGVAGEATLKKLYAGK